MHKVELRPGQVSDRAFEVYSNSDCFDFETDGKLFYELETGQVFASLKDLSDFLEYWDEMMFEGTYNAW